MFDPAFPADHALIEAAPFRTQFTGLKDLIDALPAITAAQVDAVNTVNPGDPATVNLSVVGSTLHFSFALPRGSDGQAGLTGPPGNGVVGAVVDAVTMLNPGDNASAQASFDGSTVHFSFALPRGGDGLPGPAGAPFTNFVIDGVTTLNPADPATVQTTFDGNAIRLFFGIPSGQTGPQGATGPPFGSAVVDSVTTLNPGDNATVQTSFDGSVHFTFGIPRGPDGQQGPPGEVTNAQLSTAINTAIVGTCSNSNAVSTLDTPFANDPPTLADLELMRAKLNVLITALRR